MTSGVSRRCFTDGCAQVVVGERADVSDTNERIAVHRLVKPQSSVRVRS